MSDAERLSVPFSWNGRRFLARPGDTIAAALWRHGVVALGASRKRHRPLGISGAFVQGALVEVDGHPHVRADEMLVTPHLRVRQQGVWPSARFDCLRLLRFVPARWIRGGFEHPRWLPGGTRRFEIWERLMMFLAGEVSVAPEGPRLSSPLGGRRWDGDVIVVGGGPAGRAAANAAAQAGMHTCLISLSDTPGSTARALGAVLSVLNPKIEVFARHQAVGIYRRGTVVLAAPLAAAEPAAILVGTRLILANGRRSTPPLVSGLDLPGVLDAHSAVRLASMVKSTLGPAVVVGTGAQAPLARALAQQGVEIAAVRAAADLCRIEGRRRVERAVFADESPACRALIHAGPWISDPGLRFQAACEGELRLAATALPNHVSVVGDAALADEAVHVAALGMIQSAAVCPCMDATVGEVLSHVRAGRAHVEVLKRATSCGMGPCQGFPCWEYLCAVVQRAQPSASFDDRPTHRPPRRGLTVEQAAGLDGLLELE